MSNLVLRCSISVLIVLLLSLDYCVGQGMVAVTPPPASEEKVRSTEDTDMKPLSPQKIMAHKKIATAHLEERHEDDGQTDRDRVAVKDKPVDLQDPDKHASEDFIVPFLLKQYPQSTSTEERVEILQNLENYCHKFENGRDLFKATSALKEILLPALNSSDASVRSSAVGVFATACQNNREVQELASDAGVIRVLINLISFDLDSSVRSRALWALAAMIRNFQRGQKKFIADGGIKVLVKVATSTETRKRTLNFITDLLDERSSNCREPIVIDTENLDPESDPCDELQILEKSLKESGWCDVIRDSVSNLPGFDVEDQIQTVEAVASSLPLCKTVIRPHAHLFRVLAAKLTELGEDEDWSSEVDIVNQVIKGLKDVEQQQSNRDEL